MPPPDSAVAMKRCSKTFTTGYRSLVEPWAPAAECNRPWPAHRSHRPHPLGKRSAPWGRCRRVQTSTRNVRAIRRSPDGLSSPVARIRAHGRWAGRSEMSDLRRPRPAPLAAPRAAVDRTTAATGRPHLFGSTYRDRTALGPSSFCLRLPRRSAMDKRI